MKRRKLAGAIGAGLVLLTVACVLTMQPSAQGSGPQSSGRIRDFTTSLTITDLYVSNPGGLTALKIGDTLTETNVQTANGNQIATNILTCTVGAADEDYFESICTLLVKFADGDMSLQGFIEYPVSDAPLKPYHFAIVGGTGAYQNARGQMVGMDRRDGPGELKYHVILKP